MVLRPRDAVALEAPAGADPDVVGALAPVVAGLVHAPRPRPSRPRPAGVRRVALADVVEQLPPPRGRGWRRLLPGLAPLAEDAQPERRWPRCPCPSPAAASSAARARRRAARRRGGTGRGAAGARGARRRAWSHPEWLATRRARRLLERLGARPTAGRAALELPEVVRGASPRWPTTKRRRSPIPTAARWCAAVLDPRRGGRRAPAALAPGDLPCARRPAAARRRRRPGARRRARAAGVGRGPPARPRRGGRGGRGILARGAGTVLRAVGVLDGLAVLRAADVALDAPPDAGARGRPRRRRRLARRAGGLAADAFGSTLGATVGEVDAVRDLDLVLDDAWPEVLELLGGDPELRAALLTPVRLAGPAGGRRDGALVHGVVAARAARRGGRLGGPRRRRAALAALLPPAPPALAAADPAVRAALGGRPGRRATWTPRPCQGVLAGLADPEVDLDAGTALRIWAALAASWPAPSTSVPTAGRVRVLQAGAPWSWTPAGRASPATRWCCSAATSGGSSWRPARGPPAASPTCSTCRSPRTSRRGVVDEPASGAGSPTSPAAAALVPGGARRWCEHDELLVDGAEVDWWVGRRRRARARGHARRAGARPGVGGRRLGARGGRSPRCCSTRPRCPGVLERVRAAVRAGRDAM